MLSDTDRAILDFEATWWKYAGAKESEIRSKFGISSTIYYQRLHALLEQPEALEVNAMLVRRLRRLRDARRAARLLE